ncbi:MAG: dihydrodipicolinate synthase family protein [Kiritimatiellia bacterium]|nr:dihydrodipicolinate synthase family protein [Kiritimatiellia bacterium]
MTVETKTDVPGGRRGRLVDALFSGLAIPALPLALRADRTWSERHQKALIRYYRAAGAGGVAVGVHSTQFAIREPRHGLFRPLLDLAARVIRGESGRGAGPFLGIAGVCGDTPQAIREIRLAAELGYDAALVSLAALNKQPIADLIEHCRALAEILPIIGFYLQPAVGGRVLPIGFWREFAQMEGAVAIKMAPFNRYQTLDVVRAVAESGREDLALYTGNDDNIVADLLTPWTFGGKTLFIRGGLLGQFGVWTKAAVEWLEKIKAARTSDTLAADWWTLNAAWTDANAAIFDAAHGFSGCIPGIHEVLHRQGLLPSIACLDPEETLSPGQAEEITRVARAYPQLTDDAFVREHRDAWLEEGA